MPVMLGGEAGLGPELELRLELGLGSECCFEE
jgi:hypothetical protein